MSQGFTKTHIMDGLVRDNNAASPACFENNLTAGSAAARLGTTLTGAAANTKAASYTDLIASTAQIANGIWVAGHDVAVNTTDTSQLLDIAKGGAGAEVDLITNINMGQASVSAGVGALVGNGKIFYFPGLSIPASTRISGRIQSTVVSDTLVVSIWMDYRIQWQIGNSAWVTYGADTANSRGTSVPPGSSAFGAWTNIGTTSRNHNLWSVGFDLLADTAQTTGNMVLIEIGYGPTSITVVSIGVVQLGITSSEGISGCFPPVLSFVVASGSLLWARIASNETDNRGIIIYGN